jgi:protein SCO1/2
MIPVEMRRFLRGALAAAGVALIASNGAAHDGAHDSIVLSAPMLEGKADFSLIDHTGVRRSDIDFRGRYMLVYFGYTECPYTCGIALTGLVESLDRLGEAAARLAPLFITVDPENDTPARMAAYVGKFHPDLIGLTGMPEEVCRVLANFRIEATVAADPGTFERLVNHTPFIYLFGPDGALLTFLPPILPPERMAEIIASYIH